MSVEHAGERHPKPPEHDVAIDTAGEPAGRCDVSVVIPAYKANKTLYRCVESVLQQDFPGSLEVVVCASGDDYGELPTLLPDPRLRLTSSVPRLSAAVARNRGAEEARGEGIAFADADVLVSKDWLQRLVHASAGTRCVAGSVGNGTPESLIGSAEYLMQFIDVHPERKPDAVHFGATCNLYFPRALWESSGPFPEEMDGGEDTLVTAALRRQGLFVFEGRALVYHLNRTGLYQFVRHQYEFGRFSARIARSDVLLAGTRLRQRLQSHVALVPVAVMGKICWIYFRVFTLDRGLVPTAIRCLPLIVCGVCAWGVGLLVEGFRSRDARSPGASPLS
jgi:glycosyltransferase involved in cell wall biosynthesis